MRKFLGAFLICGMIAAACPAFAERKPDTRALRQQAFAGRAAVKADQIVIYKGKRQMYLMRDGRILRKYRVALGKNPVGHKIESGDNRTPEGKYRIDMKNPNSAYFLSIRISYPDASDAQVADALDTQPGDWIMIHGLPNDRTAAQVGHPDKDWTNGCIAVTDEEMVEIWQMVDKGVRISIWP